MKRVLLFLGFIIFAFGAIFWCGDAPAQDETIISATQLVAVIDQSGLCYPLVSPAEPSLSSQALGIFWTDFSQLTNAIGDVRNFDGETQYGITVWRLRLTRTTNEVTFSYAAADTNLLQLAATEDSFANYYEKVLRTWCILGAFRNSESYEDLLADGFTFLDPKRIVLDITIADINDCGTYEDNVATANFTAGGFTAMDEEDSSDDLTPGLIDGDPCGITNLLQRFSVTAIQHNTNASTTITWESCPIFRYRVLTADALSTNTVWTSPSSDSYVWGQPAASTTSWTDLSTTNTTVVTQRFYQVEKLLGNQLAAGGSNSLAVLTNGSLWAWGRDAERQLGDGATDDQAAPEPITDPLCGPARLTNAVALAGGSDYGVAVDARGVVWSWGDGADGRLGNGGTTNVSTPLPINGISNVVSVAAGDAHTLALRADGTVWAWGSDDSGQLGVGGLPSPFWTNSPIQSLGLTQKIVAIAAGDTHSVALDSNGHVWTWGNGSDGEMANGGFTNLTLPTLLTNIANVIAIAAGFDHTVVLTTNKTVWTWGNPGLGQLGRTGAFEVPGPVTGLTGVVAIAAGNEFTLVVTSNGQLYAWGDNPDGELGTNGFDVPEADKPLLVGGVSNAVLVSANPDGDHGLAMTVKQGTNQYYSWGNNSDGQAGDGGGEVGQFTPALLHFCDACTSCVQLGTGGVFTAQCTGTLKLYFNDVIAAFGDNGGSYTVTVNGLATNVTVMASNAEGAPVGIVTKGSNYTYTASGFCAWGTGASADPNGNDSLTLQPEDCSGDIGELLCPTSHCFSLFGRIQ